MGRRTNKQVMAELTERALKYEKLAQRADKLKEDMDKLKDEMQADCQTLKISKFYTPKHVFYTTNTTLREKISIKDLKAEYPEFAKKLVKRKILSTYPVSGTLIMKDSKQGTKKDSKELILNGKTSK